MTSRQCRLPDAAATEDLGRRLAEALRRQAGRGPVVIHLRGELGAGKSTLARALLRALGVAGAIRSPTYTLVERYDTVLGEALHLDLYRLQDVGEVDYLGIDELLDKAVLWLIEWPERGQGVLPPADLVLELRHEGGARSLRVEAMSASAAALLDRLGGALAGPG